MAFSFFYTHHEAATDTLLIATIFFVSRRPSPSLQIDIYTYFCYNHIENILKFVKNLEVFIIKKLIIAEKPDVMKQFVKALDSKAKATSRSKYVYYYEGKQYVFASACGHLFQAQPPEIISSKNQKWAIAPLDVPDILPFQKIPSSSGYYACLQELVKRKDIDEIVIATDPDREGQLIWYLISMHLKLKVPVTRVWIKEWTAKGLSDAFKNRKNNKTYHNLELAGLCRLEADYLIGLTGTRVNTVAFGGYKNVINEGRVQSPTRYIVYLNHKSIEDFIPEKYSQILLNIKTETKENLCLTSDKITPSLVKNVEKSLVGQSFNIHKETKKKNVNCPKLYKTNTILVDASNKLGLSVEKTTEILQKLYQDYSLTTYPRTEIDCISSSSAKEVMKIVNSLEGIGLVDDIVDEIKTYKYSFQNHLIAKGGEMPHEAITPTYNGNPKSVLHKLSKDELAVYKLIVERFLMGFYPPAVIEETTVKTEHIYDGQKYTFSTFGKMILKESWMKIKGIGKETMLPLVYDGKNYPYASSKIENKTTKPPARYTESTLLEAMENAGRFVEDEDAKKILKDVKGIGTGATRNDILKNLFKNGFLIKKGKSIYPTEKTIQMMEILPNSPLTSPMMTADLENKLSMIENGTLTFEDFMKSLHKQVDDIIEAAKNAPIKRKVDSVAKYPSNSAVNSELGNCPFCGKPMKENSKSYYCSGYKDGCTFSIWKEIAGKKITQATAKKLIGKGVTGVLKGFVSKKGTKFDAKLIVNKNTKKIEFQFTDK